MNQSDVSRRRFLAQVAMAVPAGALVLGAVNTASAEAAAKATVPAAALPKLELTDPSAKALLYVDDASKVDRKNPLAARYTPAQNCASCAQIKGKPGDAYRPCGIFPGKLVASKGWCSVWAAPTP